MNQGVLWGALIAVVIAVGGVLLIASLVGQQQVPPQTITRTPVAPADTDAAGPVAPAIVPPSPPTSPFLSVSPQAPGTTVTVDTATLAQNGFIVIHEDANGQPGAVIGNSSLLTAGTHAATSVSISRASKEGETLFPMLHNDADGDGLYTFPGPDVPTTDAAGTVVTVPVLVSAQTVGSATTTGGAGVPAAPATATPY